MALLEIFLVQFPIGFLTSLSPCLFPLMPSYLAILAKNKQNSTFHAILSVLSMMAGLLIVYTLFGLIASTIISFSEFVLANQSAFFIFQGLLLIAIGILLIHSPQIIRRIPIPKFVDNMLYGEQTENNILYTSFLIGLFFTFIAAPCAASYFLLSWSSAAFLPFPERLLSFLFFTLGASVPFAVMALLVPELKATFIQSLNKSSELLQKIVGAVVILSGLWLIFTRGI